MASVIASNCKMLLKNIRKWDTEFLNPGMISFPSSECPRRLISNIDYYFSNYVIIFLLLFFVSLLFHFTLLLEIAVSGLVWQFAVSKSSVWKGILTSRDIGIIFIANVLIIVLINGYALFCSLGTGVLALLVHAFLWDETQHRKPRDNNTGFSQADEGTKITEDDEAPRNIPI